jgi:hypothetical protein
MHLKINIIFYNYNIWMMFQSYFKYPMYIQDKNVKYQN